MSRIRVHVVSAAVLCLAGTALMPACATNDQTIFIQQVMAPSVTRTATGTCTYIADPTQPAALENILDVGIRDDYVGVLLVGNQEVPRGDPANAKAESNRAHLNGATVHIANPDGSSIPGVNDFTSLASGFANISQGNTPGYGLLPIRLVDAPSAAAMGAALQNRTQTKTVAVTVRAFGKTLGGIDIESGDFQFPLTVCRGCLVQFTQAATDPAAPLPNCAKPVDTTQGSGVTLPCFPGQDEVTPCQICQGRPACDPKTP